MTRLLMLSMLWAGVSGAADPRKVSAREEITRLEKELAAQRALMVRMLELQNQCTTQMIKAVQGQEPEVPFMPEPLPPPPPPPASISAPPLERSPAPSASRSSTPPSSNRGSSAAAKFGAISGKVHVNGGGPSWVFVEDVKGPATGGTAEIKQEDKQFSPRLLAVPSGTRLTFPNLDVVYHNVFSLTPGLGFDMGMLRAGDPVKSRVMNKPGVLEIFCNLHARMSATVLVTPGPLIARVGRDGTFTIENVPLGSHKVSAWAGGPAVASKTVEVGQEGGKVDFQLSAPQLGKAHTNKAGQPYGSYDD